MRTRMRREWVRLSSLTAALGLVATLAVGDGTAFVRDVTSSVPRTVAGAAPAQHSGTAASRSHKARTASTAAAGTLGGRSSGPTPKGALPPDRKARPLKLPGKPKTAPERVEALPAGTAPESKGYDPATSTEDVSRRGERVQTFDNADGTSTTRVYKDPEFYRTSDGSWQPVDTAVSARRVERSAWISGPMTSSSGWTVDSSGSPLRFAPTAAGDPVVTMRLDDAHTVGYGVAGAAAVPGRSSGDTVSYADTRPDADLELTATSGGVKEDIVLKSPDAPADWVFPLRLDGLTAAQAAGGSIVFKDAAGKVRAPSPRAGWRTRP